MLKAVKGSNEALTNGTDFVQIVEKVPDAKGESRSEKRGAEHLLEAIKILFEDLNIDKLAKEKLTGLTTDGENANAGNHSGIWVRMKHYLQRDVLCMWYLAYKSDLVLPDVEMNVTEIKHW
ncbi:hypothetical protein FQA39_LY18281 [Lamprigera yunnana]|nr:hypothetical protein FQA39_LY18281 [Lamprigera yunnana]